MDYDDFISGFERNLQNIEETVSKLSWANEKPAKYTPVTEETEEDFAAPLDFSDEDSPAELTEADVEEYAESEPAPPSEPEEEDDDNTEEFLKLVAELTELQGKIAMVDNDREAVLADVADVKKARADLQAKTSSIQRQVDTRVKGTAEQMGRTRGVMDRIDQAKKEITVQEKKISGIKHEMGLLNSTARDLRKKITGTQKSITESVNDRSRLDDDLKDIRKAVGRAEEAMKARRKEQRKRAGEVVKVIGLYKGVIDNNRKLADMKGGEGAA